MQITLIDFSGNYDPTTYEYEGAVTLTYDHLWDKSGREPELIAHFDDVVERWIDNATGNTFTDLLIGEVK